MMKYFKNQNGEVCAYEQSDIDTANSVTELESNLHSAQLHLASLIVPEDVLEEGDEQNEGEVKVYEAARRAVIEAQGDLDAVLPVFFDIREKLKTLTEMTPEEIDAHLNPSIVPEQIADAVRAQRDALLVACDWVVVRTNEMDLQMPQDWSEYRQALRDVPQQGGFPEDIEWPEPPK